MLLIHQECFEGPCVFYPTEGISIIFECILEFSFALPTFREPIGDIWKKKRIFTKLYIV